MTNLLNTWLSKIGVPETYLAISATTLKSLLVLIVAALIFIIVKRILVAAISRFINRTESDLDDVLVRRKVFHRLAMLAPAVVIHELIPFALGDFPAVANLTGVAISVYAVWVTTLAIDAAIGSFLEIYHTFEVSKRLPIQNFGQVARLLLYFIATILTISMVIDESPLSLFAGLGAMTAVLMLVFKDPILGFVAGLQLSANKMVNLGDWVDIPQHKASGNILEIGLTTVKVQNFDNTITTVPTQALINDSFKNWRGMQESGGRRIKRALYIDVNSISFCNEERLRRYSKIEYIQDYISQKQKELDSYNTKHDINESLVNGRRVTNIGTFRAYIQAYLKNHPKINQQLTLLVRQLATTDSGVPIEIYAFSADKVWANYEAIQADIFDHLFAVAREFDLRLFQRPSGYDFHQALSAGD